MSYLTELLRWVSECMVNNTYNYVSAVVYIICIINTNKLQNIHNEIRAQNVTRT